MNKQLNSILRAVLVGVVTAKILAWVGDARPPVAPANHYYLIVTPSQPDATAQPEDERLAAQTWGI